MTQADELRAAIGKKKMVLFDKCMKDFSKGCKARGIDENVISNVASLIQKFGKYGFNKAHAASYAVIGFWNMWLKTYYPAEWYTAVFTVQFEGNQSKKKMLSPCYCKGTSVAGKFAQDFKQKLDWYIYGVSSGGFDGKQKKCAVCTPSLNISHHKEAVIAMVDGEERIYLPFGIIEGLGGNTAPIAENRKLLPNKKYSSIKQFVEYSGIAEGLARKLIDNKVFEDDFGDDTMKLNAELTHYIKVRQEERRALQQRARQTTVSVDENIKDLLFGDFKGVNSIKMLDNSEIVPEVKKKPSKTILIEDGWFDK